MVEVSRDRLKIAASAFVTKWLNDWAERERDYKNRTDAYWQARAKDKRRWWHILTGSLVIECPPMRLPSWDHDRFRQAQDALDLSNISEGETVSIPLEWVWLFGTRNNGLVGGDNSRDK